MVWLLAISNSSSTAVTTQWNLWRTRMYLFSCFEFMLKENIGPEEHWSRSREFLSRRRLKYLQRAGTLPYLNNNVLSDFHSIQACSHGFYHSNRNAPTAKRIDIHNYWIETAGHTTRWGYWDGFNNGDIRGVQDGKEPDMPHISSDMSVTVRYGWRGR